MNRIFFFHDSVTRSKLTQAEYELARLGYQSTALPVELSSTQGLEKFLSNLRAQDVHVTT